MKALEKALLAAHHTPPEVLHDLHQHPDKEVVRHLAWHPNVGVKTRKALRDHTDPVVRLGARGEAYKLYTPVGEKLAQVYRNGHHAMHSAHRSLNSTPDDRFRAEDELSHRIAGVLDHAASHMADRNYPQHAIKHVMEVAHEHALHLTQDLDYQGRGRHLDSAFNMAHHHSEYYDAWK